MSDNTILVRIAKLFEQPGLAYQLLKQHSNGDGTIRVDGIDWSLTYFYKYHKAMHRQRTLTQTRHYLSILRSELSNVTGYLNCNPYSIKKPDLNYYDNLRDHRGHYEAYLGIWDCDQAN